MFGCECFRNRGRSSRHSKGHPFSTPSRSGARCGVNCAKTSLFGTLCRLSQLRNTRRGPRPKVMRDSHSENERLLLCDSCAITELVLQALGFENSDDRGRTMRFVNANGNRCGEQWLRRRRSKLHKPPPTDGGLSPPVGALATRDCHKTTAGLQMML